MKSEAVYVFQCILNIVEGLYFSCMVLRQAQFYRLAYLISSITLFYYMVKTSGRYNVRCHWLIAR